ncbi:MAG: DUF1501 domain-containing protein [Myxococcota bacterium]
MLDRRQVLGLFAAAGALATLGLPSLGRAGPKLAPRLIVVLLRGGMDGLHAVVPYGDPAYEHARGSLALPSSSVLDLDGTFGLHPALSPIAPWFAEGQLLPLHALGLPYQERSHFDAQDVLDNGSDRPNGARDGWLNRAMAALPHSTGVSLGANVPLILRGSAPVLALDPNRRRAANDGLLDALDTLYGGDPDLQQALRMGRESLTLLPETAPEGRRGSFGGRVIQTLANVTTHPEGATAVAIEVGGWDTHANQGTTGGALARRLGGLAEGLVGLRTALGDAWDQTAVVVLTEFGRTISPNGTGGTDHGIGSAGFLLGGAVNGGRVHADWPGLSPKEQVGNRDLRATTDIRAVLAGVLRDHLGLDRRGIEATLPGFSSTLALPGLVRSA